MWLALTAVTVGRAPAAGTVAWQTRSTGSLGPKSDTGRPIGRLKLATNHWMITTVAAFAETMRLCELMGLDQPASPGR